jgi:protein involved in plasmid replication-relaxation
MQRLVITTVDETILQQFTTYPYLTAAQVTRLLYSKGSAHYVSAKLKSLTQQKYLHRLDRENINYPYVYSLGIRGIRYLQSLDSNASWLTIDLLIVIFCASPLVGATAIDGSFLFELLL